MRSGATMGRWGNNGEVGQQCGSGATHLTAVMLVTIKYYCNFVRRILRQFLSDELYFSADIKLIRIKNINARK